MAGVDFPYPQANARAWEADALRLWAGDGSVRLLAVEPETGSLLLEACDPGVSLADAKGLEEADDIAAPLLLRLWRAPPEVSGLPTVDDLAADMAERADRNFAAAGTPFERRLLDDALRLLDDLRASGPGQVLLHGDFHHNNILAAGREQWLAIDPLPRLGEPAFDAVMFLLFRKGSMPDPERQWEAAIRSFCHQLGVDAERVKAWTFVRLVSDTLAALTVGLSVAHLESFQEDLWSARLLWSLL